MLANSTASLYSVNEDTRYNLFDSVNFYTVFKYANGTLSTMIAENRTLNGLINMISVTMLIGTLIIHLI